jgi:uroporphyrinogen-III synthase
LKQAGIEVGELPMIRFTKPRERDTLSRALLALAKGEFDITILSSPTGVEHLVERLADLELNPHDVSACAYSAVGVATADALNLAGFAIAFPIPIAGGSHELVQLLGDYVRGKKLLLLQSQIGLEHLEHALTEAGGTVERVTLYETHGPSIADAARLLTILENGSRPDVIAFFSPSSVQFFIRTLAEMASGLLRSLPAIAAIGETTAKAIEEGLHRRPEIVARKSNQQTLAEDIITYLALR